MTSQPFPSSPPSFPSPSQPPPVFQVPGRAMALSALRTVVVMALLVAVYYAVPVDDRTGWAVVVGFAVLSALFVYVVIRQLRAIVKARHPQLRAIEGLVMAATVWILVYSLLYLQVVSADPTAFSQPMTRTAAIYFTVTVLSTVGFGDITAVTDGARVLVTVQMLGNLIIIGMAVRIITHVAQTTLAQRAASREAAAPPELTP